MNLGIGGYTGFPTHGGELRSPFQFYPPNGRFKRPEEHVPRPWISNNGEFLKDGRLIPEAFDPGAPHQRKGRTYQLSTNPDFDLEDPFDLHNLRFFDPSYVREKWVELERIADRASDKEIVAMIGMGGTIAMCPSDSGELVPALNSEYLLEYAGCGLKEQFSTVSLEFPTLIDSSQGEIDYAADLVIAMSWIWKNSSERMREAFAGFLITHGTDTIAEDGCYITMMLGPDCPFTVGLVGAQRSIDPNRSRYTDVAPNVANSFDTLHFLKQCGKTATFTYGGGTSGGAFEPVGVIKDNDKTPNYLRSPVHPPILDALSFADNGTHLPFRDAYSAELKKKGTTRDERFRPIIMRGYQQHYSVESKLGERPELHFKNILESSAKDFCAVVLTTFGSFTANNKLFSAILDAASLSNRVLFAVSPFPDGNTTNSRYGPSEQLKKHAVHILHSALYAKITLGWHIYGNNCSKLREFVMERNYVGEQIPSHWERWRKEQRGNVLLGTPSEILPV